jgi:hypothetical protein
MKSKLIITLLIALVAVQQALAQSPEIEWTRVFGLDSADIAYSVQQTMDGGYVYAGKTGPSTWYGTDALLVKTDSLGNIDWYRLYGGVDYDDAGSVQQTSDGGYILAGRTTSYGSGVDDMYVVKTDSQGDTLWTRTYGGTSSDGAYSVQQTTDGGYVIAGDSRETYMDLFEMYLVKTDSLGDTIWTRTYGGSDDRTAYSVKQTANGGYVMAGYNSGGIESDIYVVKTDSLGNLQWIRSYGGYDYEIAQSILQTTDGGYIVVGSTLSFGAGGSDVYVIKADSLGDTLWTCTYGGTGFEYADEVQQTNDGGYIIAGCTESFGSGGYDLYLIKINTFGDTVWTIVYGSEDSEYGRSVDLTNDGGYIIAGEYSICLPPYDYLTDAWLVKTGPDTAVSHAPSIKSMTFPNAFALQPAYPNPFNPTTTICYEVPVRGIVRVDIYNVLGRKTAELVNGIKTAGQHQITWDAGDLPSGIYFVQMEGGNYRQVQRVVLLK